MRKCECRDSKLVTIVRELKYSLGNEGKYTQFELFICENCSGISTEPEEAIDALLFQASPKFLEAFYKHCQDTQDKHKNRRPFKVYRENGNYIIGVEEDSVGKLR